MPDDKNSSSFGNWLSNLFSKPSNNGLAGFTITSPDNVNYTFDASSNSLIRDPNFMGPAKYGDQIQLGNANASNGLFGSGVSFGDVLSAGTGILQGIAGLRQAQMAEQQLKLAKQQFGFQKGLANRNLANQAKVINNQYDNAAQVAAGMMGGVDANGNYGMVNPEVVSRYSQAAKEKHVDGSAID